MRTLKREHTLLPESSSDETENQEERCRDGEEMDSPKIGLTGGRSQCRKLVYFVAKPKPV